MVGMFKLGATSVSSFYGRIVRLRVGESGSTHLVDQSGRVIYHSDVSRTGEDFSDQPAVRELAASGSGAIRTRSITGEDIVAGFAPVPGTPWSLITEESWSALTSAGKGYQQFLGLMPVIGVVLPALIVAVGLRRLMRPVDRLTAAAREVGGGNLDVSVSPSNTGGELEILATSFNQMTRQVAGRTRELEQLEELGRAILNGPPDASTLSEVLREHVLLMFPQCRLEIRVFPDQTLLRHPDYRQPVAASAWEWLAKQSEARHFLPEEIPPWDTQATDDALVLTPILDMETKEPMGGIHLSLDRDPDAAPSLLPAVQSLAAQIPRFPT